MEASASPTQPVPQQLIGACNVVSIDVDGVNRPAFVSNSEGSPLGFFSPHAYISTATPPVETTQAVLDRSTPHHQQPAEPNPAVTTLAVFDRATPYQQQPAEPTATNQYIFSSPPGQQVNYAASQSPFALPAAALPLPNYGPAPQQIGSQRVPSPLRTPMPSGRRPYSIVPPTVNSPLLTRLPGPKKRRSVIDAVRRLFAFWASLLAMVITIAIIVVLRRSIKNQDMFVHLFADATSYSISWKRSCVIGLAFVLVLASFSMEFFHLVLVPMFPALRASCLRLRTRAFVYFTFSLLGSVMALLQAFNIAALLAMYMIPCVLFYTAVLRGEDRVLSPNLKPRMFSRAVDGTAMRRS